MHWLNASLPTVDVATTTAGPLALATVAFAAGLAWLAYRLARAVVALLFKPLYYRASGIHLLDRAPSKRGLVTRNLPRGSDDGERPLPPYPNGWFFVDQSDAVPPGAVRHISMLGLELAVFRDARGHVHALDAYCPHLGANMAIGGQVVGDCLECPFHGWQFRGSDGACQHIPGAKRVPDAASTRTWRLLERNGAILLWHHVDDAEPDWLPPQMDEFALATQMCGRTEHIVFAHIQEIPENGADVAHLDPVHKVRASCGSDMRSLQGGFLSALRHGWTVSSLWKPFEPPDDHLAHFGLDQDFLWGSRKLPMTKFETSITQVGPGLVYLSMSGKVLGSRLMLCHYVVPEEPFKQRLTHVMYTQPGWFNWLFAKFVLSVENVMVERDVQIWNNKCNRQKPVFAASSTDEGLLRFRRWYSQFYSGLTTGKQTKAANGRSSLDW